MEINRIFKMTECFGPVSFGEESVLSGICRGRVTIENGERHILIGGCTEGRILVIDGGLSSRFCHLTGMKKECQFRPDPEVPLVNMRKRVRKR